MSSAPLEPATSGPLPSEAPVPVMRLVGIVAFACAVLVALALPAGYFLLTHGAEERESRVAARLHAAFITQVVLQSPGDWRSDVAGLIESDLAPSALPEQRTVTDRAGTLVSASGPPVPGPVLTRTAELLGRDGPIGVVAVHRSLRPVLLRTALVGALGLLAGAVIFGAMHLLRRRALERATEAVRREEARTRAQVEQSLRVIFGHAIDGIVMLSAEGRVLSANPAAQQLLGQAAESLAGRSLGQCLAPAEGDPGERPGSGKFEALVERPDGSARAVDVTISDTGTGAAGHRIVMLRDITERKRQEAHLERLAKYDTLTGLPNRSQFMHNLRQAMGRARRHRRAMALMFLDLDRFKIVNDSLGHAVGDQLLQHVAALLSAGLREGDTLVRRGADREVYRLGGDEFTVVLEDLDRAESAATVAGRLIELIEQPLTIAGHLLYVSTSIGIALFEPDDPTDLEGLVKQADMAMYQAKEVARGSYQFFSAELGARAQARQEIEVGLRGALERGEFALHYQPKADLRQGRVTGVEALLRWQRPGQAPVGPDRFVPVLEETGLIVPVGLWVLQEACRQVAQWNREQALAISVAVNLSSRQLHQPDLAEQIAGALRESGLRPSLLEIELTESMLVDDSEAVLHILRGIKALGVRVAIDDFGTGHSSLSYLRRFNVDTLKIDRSFVCDTPGDTEDCAIALAVIALGHGLNLRVVAEGVETAEQAEFLRAHGCDAIQGYLLSRPLPADEVPSWMARHAHVALLEESVVD